MIVCVLRNARAHNGKLGVKHAMRPPLLRTSFWHSVSMCGNHNNYM